VDQAAGGAAALGGGRPRLAPPARRAAPFADLSGEMIGMSLKLTDLSVSREALLYGNVN
jgi:hypothetical protein